MTVSIQDSDKVKSLKKVKVTRSREKGAKTREYKSGENIEIMPQMSSLKYVRLIGNRGCCTRC